MQHVEQTKTHQLHHADLEYADENALLAATGLSAATYGNRVGKALAENTFFVLVDTTTSPVTWEKISGPDNFTAFVTVPTHVDNTWYTLYLDGVSKLRQLIGVDVSATISALIIGVDEGNDAYWSYKAEGLLWLNDGSYYVSIDVTDFYQYSSVYDAQIVISSEGDIKVQVRRSGGVDYGPVKWKAVCLLVEQAYDD